MRTNYFKEIENKGFTVIKIPKIVKKNIKDSILKVLNEKVSFKRKNFNEASKKITTLKQENFLDYFGHVSKRYLKKEHSRIFNNWAKKNLKKILKKSRVSLHYSCVFDRRVNKKLDSKQYCIYFRCVRPKVDSDVGTTHRDKDFWKLIKKNEIPKAPFKYKNLFKIWIPIYSCNYENSLRFYKKSNLDEKNKAMYFIKNKRSKPYYKTSYLKSIKNDITQPIKNFNNEAILFSDNVLHFAPKNKKGKSIRLSVEATIVTD